MTQTIKKILGLKPPQIPHSEAVHASELRANTTHIIGFEFDGTASFRKGTVDGPDAIRAVADGIESYSPYLDKDTSLINEFLDIGNLPVGRGENIEVNLSLSEDGTVLVFSFRNDETTFAEGRILGLEGDYVFELDKQ
jgi:agmatinase